MKILMTGFDPFGGEDINPAFEAVKKVKADNGIDLVKLEIPTVFTKSSELIFETIEKENPDAVLMVGQAGGRASITVEKVAINYRDARIEDNDGKQPIGEKIFEDGKDGIFASIDVEEVVQAIRDEGVPANISYTAGTFVCNDVLYSVLYHIDKEGLDIKAGFIHLPYLPSQTLDKKETPSMDIDSMVRGLQAAVKTIGK